MLEVMGVRLNRRMVVAGTVGLFFIVAVSLVFVFVRADCSDFGELDVVAKAVDICDEIEELFVVKSIPEVRLFTEAEQVSRENYSPVSVQLIDEIISENTTEMLDGEIRARGNSTYELGRDFGGPMPYKIKLAEKQSLLGMGEHKKWNLLVNFYDRSYVKQFIAFGAAGAIYGQNGYFQPKVKYVEVYFNNDYKGLYLLAESIEEDDGALDIEVEMAGYGDNLPFLLEMNCNTCVSEYYAQDRDKLRRHFDEDMFFGDLEVDTPDWLLDSDLTNDLSRLPQPFMLQYPKTFSDISESQGDNIKRSVRTLYADVAAGESLGSLDLDVESFVNLQVFCEIFADPSCAHGPSAYFYRRPDNRKVVAGPLWDFDTSLLMGGVTFRQRNENNVLIAGLLENLEFREKLAARYERVYADIMPDMKSRIEELKNNQILKDAVHKAEGKYDTWNRVINRQIGHTTPDYPDKKVLAIKTYEGHIDYILDILFGGQDGELGRVEWIYQNLDNWGDPDYH